MQDKATRSLVALLVCLLLTSLLFQFSGIGDVLREAFGGKKAGEAVLPTGQWRIFASENDYLYLSTSEKGVDEPINTGGIGFVDPIVELGNGSRLFRVLNNTRVRVVGSGTGMMKVMIDEDGRTYSGAEGWIEDQYLAPLVQDSALIAFMPRYTVIQRMGTHVEALLPNVATDTPEQTLADYAARIAQFENVGTVTMYRTLEARQANYARQLGAGERTMLRAGFLGMYKDDSFYDNAY